MFTSYLKVAVRNIKKHKGVSFINISGLAIGIACFILIMLYVQYEFSYDRYNEKVDRIYRVCSERTYSTGRVRLRANTPNIMADALVSDFPEVIMATRLSTATLEEKTPVQYKGKKFLEARLMFADSAFFNVFTIPLLRGNPKTVLLIPSRFDVVTRLFALRIP